LKSPRAVGVRVKKRRRVRKQKKKKNRSWKGLEITRGKKESEVYFKKRREKKKKNWACNKRPKGWVSPEQKKQFHRLRTPGDERPLGKRDGLGTGKEEKKKKKKSLEERSRGRGTKGKFKKVTYETLRREREKRNGQNQWKRS